jgi:hypothetical protein
VSYPGITGKDIQQTGKLHREDFHRLIIMATGQEVEERVSNKSSEQD